MLQPYILPLIGGFAAGILLASLGSLLYHRARQSTAQAILTDAKAEAARVQADARHEAERMVADSAREIETVRAGALVEGKMATLKLREEVEKEAAKRREELDRLEKRAIDREQSLDRRSQDIKEQENRIASRDGDLKKKTQDLEARQQALEKLEGEERRRLERVAGLSVEDARRELMQKVEDEARGEAAALTRDIREQARRAADKDAKRILSMAIQRIAAEHTAESTVAAVTLPNDEMKGRIIGREGRNIRAFETATGVDVIIDDTPDTVVISCFDPIRREVARRARWRP